MWRPWRAKQSGNSSGEVYVMLNKEMKYLTKSVHWLQVYILNFHLKKCINVVCSCLISVVFFCFCHLQGHCSDCEGTFRKETLWVTTSVSWPLSVYLMKPVRCGITCFKVWYMVEFIHANTYCIVVILQFSFESKTRFFHQWAAARCVEDNGQRGFHLNEACHFCNSETMPASSLHP